MASGMASKVVHLTVNGRPLQLNISATLKPVPARAMLPLFRSLTDAFVQLSREQAQTNGQAVSCRHGCAACCRQLISVTEAEALDLWQLIQQMQQPKQSETLRRFEIARKQFDSAGLAEQLRHPEEKSRDELIALGLQYIDHAIDCPFLEQEACSIYAHRPMACREYQVVSPAEFCSRPQDGKIKRTATIADVSGAVRALQTGQAPANRWVPLLLALEWAKAHPQEGPYKPGTEWADQLLANLQNRTSGPVAKTS